MQSFAEIVASVVLTAASTALSGFGVTPEREEAQPPRERVVARAQPPVAVAKARSPECPEKAKIRKV